MSSNLAHFREVLSPFKKRQVCVDRNLRLASQFPNITFAKVDVDEVPDVSQELGVRAMPAFFFFLDGSKIEDMVGANPPALTAAIAKLNGAS